MPKPFFSIVIPTYNRAGTIQQSIQSVLDQGFNDFELIVVDDGSTDQTKEVVKSMIDPRIQYLFKKNEERGAARNFGAQASTGDYVTFLDSDDVLHPEFLWSAQELIHKEGKIEIFHIPYDIRNTQGEVLSSFEKRKGDLNKQLLKGNPLSCLGVFLRRDIAMEFPFNEERDLAGAEDWELWMRLASRYPIHYTNIPQASLIQHDSRSMVTEDPEKLIKRIELAESLVMKDPGFQNTFGRFSNRVTGFLASYVALHLATMKKRRKALIYLRKCLRFAPQIIFAKRFYAILLNMIRS